MNSPITDNATERTELDHQPDIVQLIELDMIEPFPGNRKVGGFDPAKLEQLAESIKAVGVQQPAVVRKIERCISDHPGFENEPGMITKYQLVAGERRWRASRIAGKDTLPCIVRELDDVTAMKIQYIENLQRDDIHPLDEAEGYAQLVEKAGYTIEMLAADVGKSVSYIYQRMKLSALIPEARELFAQNKITAGHAVQIARLMPEQQKEIVEEGLFDSWSEDVISVRGLDDYIHSNILLDISKTTWKHDDAGLVPEAGSCQECPKRTGYQPALFADVCKDKKDYCLDKSCFTEKQEAIVERKRAEFEGQDILEVADGYGSASRDLPKTVLPSWQWNECKKSDPDARKVLIVAGNQPGRVTWGKLTTYTPGYQPSPEEKEKIRKEKQKQKQAEELRAAKIDAVLESVDKMGMPIEALRLVIDNIWWQWSHDIKVLVAKAQGWIGKTPQDPGELHNIALSRINSMTETQLFGLLMHLVMGCEIKTPTYGDPKTKRIDAFMKIYGIDKNDFKKRSAI